MNTFYGISFAIYFILITLVLTTFIYGLKRDKWKYLYTEFSLWTKVNKI